MYNHEPKNYICPFCQFVRGEDNGVNFQEDIIFQNKDVLAFVSPVWRVNNPGHVLVIPKFHVENLYDIKDELLAKVYAAVRKVAIAMRTTYTCTGVSTSQHNEPDGDQNVWHLHIHVFPRYKNDRLFARYNKKRFVTQQEKQKFAVKLQKYFNGE